MDTKAYIESGILETYALGMTTPEESAQVESLVSMYPEIKAELESIQLAFEELAIQNEKSPPEHLHNKIKGLLFSSNESNNVEVKQTTKVVSLSQSSSKNNIGYYIAAASVTFLIVSASLNVLLYNNLQNTKIELAELKAEKSYLVEEFEVQRANLVEVENYLTLLSNDFTKEIKLNGVGEHTDALATVFWNTQSEDVLLKINNLPQPATNKQYQLWAIVDGVPVDAGLVVYESESTMIVQAMKNFKNVDAFAITLEPKGGSENPTLEAMYVVGTI